MQDVAEPLEVGPDVDFHQQDLLAAGVEEEGVGLAFALGDEEHPVGGLNNGIDLVGCRDDNVLQLEGTLNQDRLADSEAHAPNEGIVGIGGNAQQRFLQGDVVGGRRSTSLREHTWRRRPNSHGGQQQSAGHPPYSHSHGLPTSCRH